MLSLWRYVEEYISTSTVIISFFVIYISLYIFSIIYSRLFKHRSHRNPFVIPSLLQGRSSETEILDKKQRKAMLKRAFSKEEIPEKGVDVIVIGSGIGGLALAGFLSLAGKRCLVLEKHHYVGGCCHVFTKGQYEFDTGIHYVGDMRDGTLTRRLLDQITNATLKWSKMDDDYDLVHYTDSQGKLVEISFTENQEILLERLYKHFPTEKLAIDKFFKLLKTMNYKSWHLFALKVLPLFLVNLLKKLNIFNTISSVFYYSKLSLQEVLDKLTKNDELKCVLSYCCGDYGLSPANVPFAFHAMLLNHYLKHGAYYPVGGPSEIPLRIIPTIEKTGGRVLVRANVMKFLFDSNDNPRRVIGVRVCKMEKKKPLFDSAMDLYAPTVVSACGVLRTIEMLDEALVKQSLLHRIQTRCQSSIGCFSLFLGYSLDCTELQKLGLKAQNIWALSDVDINKAFDNYVNLDVYDAAHSDMPLLFISSPSIKDPTWKKRYPNRSCIVVVGMANYNWFQPWEGTMVKKRGDDYKALKQTFTKTMLRQIDHIYPQLKDIHPDFIDLGTPLTNQFYLNSPNGAIYGLDHNLERFQIDVMSHLRPDVGIEGLLLSGQDVTTCGFTGAFYGAVLCANKYLKRDLLSDINIVTKGLKVRKSR